MRNLTLAQAIREAIYQEMERDASIIILGEDIGIFGGAFHVTDGLLEAFGPDALRAWAAGLGIDTFVGTSQRVFPSEMKAAPLLRAWLHRLRHPAPPGVPASRKRDSADR